ncbi:DUF637 domain-containing protein [Halomonas sp. LR3S48]|uniref:two-partner secretion domain-containing protein n=1 Tax=Halomonas sp. LR3S48 TaxID=2982694 RepID=UPI0021E42721|nr:DUF637 domain-containing protein [Halomonas sp. LR3S48]UYG03995.1 DUF637 domain-containing protein [Halomonas sp. LR3S48]
MNKHCYRLVFNKSKGRRVVVSEAATTDCHDGSATPRRRAGDPASPRRFELGILKPLTWSTLLALGLVTLPVHAQIAPDRSAPSSQRPHVLESANGTPQVNITAPNTQGVSRNAYRQFDVNGKGAILNNSRTATSTQIGGWVQGNPNLTTGEARVIVNEVNSSNPSRLHGAVEIAGRRAEVVIANPAGIDVDGAGFINAQGVTLTTGQPQFRNGALDGYRVEGGTVRIHGDGLDAGDADYAAILARAAEVQAGVWAEELQVVAGANRISADRRTIEAIDGSGDSPDVAIDVARLGGMYAGKITLVANERGVGVNNAGRVAASQQLTITTDGRLENRGELSSGGNLRIAGRSGIDNRGDVHAGGNAAISGSVVNNQGAIRAGADLAVTGREGIVNRDGGTLSAGGNVRLAATGSNGTIRNEQNATLAAGLRDDGSLGAKGDLDLAATRHIEANGQNLAAGGFYAEADTVSLEGSRTQAREIALTARSGDIDASHAEVVAQERLTANTTATLRTDDALVQAGQLDIAARDLSNRGGELTQSGNDALSLELDTLDNRDGRLASNGDIALHADTLDNGVGEIVAGGALSVSAIDDIDNAQGLMGAVQSSLDVTAASLDNAQGRMEAADGLRLAISGSLSNAAGEIVQLGGETPLTLDIAQALDNTDGLIVSHADLVLQAGELINEGGTLQAAGDASVESAKLSNNRGELLAGGSLALDIDGDIDNAQGQLLAQRSLTLQAASLNNAGGVVGAVEESLTVATTGAIDNRGGSLEAGSQLGVSGQGLDNQAGTLLGETITLDTGGQRLNNTAGLIAASQNLASTSGELDNTGGTLQAGGDATIDTLGQAVINVDSGTDGGILASGALTLAAGDIDNGNGLIGGGRLDVTAVDIANRLGGTLLSESDLTLAANSLDNRGGELQALGDMRLALNEALHNQGGLVRSGAALAIDANRVVNSNTQGADQGVEGQRVAITADEVVNRQGAMRANQRLEIDATSRVDNRDGLLSSLATLVLGTDDLLNRDGTLIANRQLDLAATRLIGDGRLLSLGDLALQLASDFTLNQGAELKAAGDLRFATTGTLTNRGTLQAGDTLDLDASEIDNRAGSELSGNTTRLSAGQLTNRGLIDGITTRIDATTLDNLGTGRIYGDRLGIQATTLTNNVESGRAAVIAARERLDIGARRLTNREEALLFSAGDMAIGGRLDANDRATVRATRVDNNSATIEALGDLSISAASLRNTNEHFETALKYSGSETGLFYQPVGWDEKRPAEEFQKKYSNYLYHEPTDTLIAQVPYSRHYCCLGNIYTSWREIAIEREVYSSAVTRSAPSLIQGGGNVYLYGEDVVNDKSKIVAGAMLRGDLENVVNLNAKGQRFVIESGLARSLGYQHFDSENGGEAIPYTSNWESYTNQEPLSDIILPVTEFGGNRNVSGSGTQVGTLQPTTVSGSASGAGNATAGVGNFETGRGITEVPGIGSGGASSGEPGEVIRTLMPNVRLPSNSLFRVRPNPTATYLVETDPRFTDRRQWMSSDSLLDRLSPDPAVTHKRLGDGFYEQRLIREQVTELTGQRFLEGYADDQAQYAALMNNAVTFAKEHGLRPGVALSAEQMAQLTSDIVWLVEQTVALEDGSTVKVLVPQVYTRLREGDLKGDGTLIAGDSLQLDVAGDLFNSGTLVGRELVDMTAGNLTNLEGRISGNRVDLKTRRDLTNLGGDITANESLSLQAGRDLNLASTAERQARLYVTDPDGQLLAGAGRDLTIRGAEVDSGGSLSLSAGRDLDIASTLDAQSTRYGRATLSHADIEHQATLTAGQDLTLNAGRDLGLTAVDVTAGGSGLITAGRDLALETLTTGNALSGNRSLQYRRQQEVGTNLDFGDDLTLLAGQDLYARAADVSAAGDLSVIAGRDIEIEAGHSSRYEERRNYRKHTIDSQSRVQGSDFSAGGDLTLSAGDDLRLTASRLQAGDSAMLLAGGDIEFLTAQEQDYSLYKEKSSGGMLGGSRTQRDEVSKTRSIGSEVTTGGDLLIASGQDQTYQAARLDSGGDIALQSGGTIRFETASDMHTESHERSKSSFAWQSSSGEGFTRETLRQSELVAQGELIIQAAEGIQIDVEEIDRHSVSRTIDAMVAANPDLAWLQEMEERGDIDWRQVKAIHDSWDYEQSGLGGGAAMVVAIVAAATGQYYALAALGGASAGAVAVAASAAAGSFAGTGAVSLINNRGDLGATFSDTFSSDSLRGAAIAAVTAGVTKGVMGDTTNTATGATKLDLSKTGDIARFAGQRATQAAIAAGVRTAIDGGSLSDNLEDSLESAVAHVASGVLFNAVGNYSQDRFDNGSPEKIALHALTGGAVAQAMGGDFRTGALAAGANEALVEHLAGMVNDNPGLLITASQVVGVIAAEMTDGDVNQGAEIAAQSTRYNYLSHEQKAQRDRELAECEDVFCRFETRMRWGATDVGQDASLAAGVVAGVPVEMMNGVEDLLALLDGDTYVALYELLQQDDVLTIIGEGLKDEYAQRIVTLQTEYERAGVGGAFNAGVETGKLLTDIAGVLAGGVGVARGTAGLAGRVGAVGTTRGIGGVVSRTETGMQWGRGIQGQGMPWEDFLASQLPAGSRLPPNFKTFDFYDEASGMATSVKTLDTMTSAKRANPSQVFSSIRSSVDAAANFSGYRLSGQSVTPDMITSKRLEIAVPSGTTQAQLEQIDRAVKYGADRGVTVNITVIE